MYTSSVLSWTIAPCGHARADELAPADGVAWRGAQACQDPELGRRHLHAAAAARGVVTRRIEPHAPYLESRLRPAPLDQRLESCDQLGEVERLRQVVVATRGEAGEPVGERVARGEEDDRHADAARPQRLDDVAAVRVGEPDVDHQGVGLAGIHLTHELDRTHRGRDRRTPPRAGRD